MKSLKKGWEHGFDPFLKRKKNIFSENSLARGVSESILKVG